MGIHDFNFDSFETKDNFVANPKIDIGIHHSAPKTSDLSDPGSRENDSRDCDNCDDNCYDDDIDVNFVEDVREVYPSGFKLMDKGIKNYFSGIRIPIGKGTEEYKILPVRITGADPESLVYSDKNINGARLALPLLAITRTSESFDEKRYTPPIKPIYRHLKCNGRSSESVYRQVPYLISYTLEIWSEHKSEAEYALYSIISKLNPIGSFFLEEPNMGMSHEVIVHPKGSSDSSDLESQGDSRAEIRKTINIDVEGWLPTPTKIVPTILSKPVSISEGIQVGSSIRIQGQTYSVIRDRSF